MAVEVMRMHAKWIAVFLLLILLTGCASTAGENTMTTTEEPVLRTEEKLSASVTLPAPRMSRPNRRRRQKNRRRLPRRLQPLRRPRQTQLLQLHRPQRHRPYHKRTRQPKHRLNRLLKRRLRHPYHGTPKKPSRKSVLTATPTSHPSDAR